MKEVGEKRGIFSIIAQDINWIVSSSWKFPENTLGILRKPSAYIPLEATGAGGNHLLPSGNNWQEATHLEWRKQFLRHRLFYTLIFVNFWFVARLFCFAVFCWLYPVPGSVGYLQGEHEGARVPVVLEFTFLVGDGSYPSHVVRCHRLQGHNMRWGSCPCHRRFLAAPKVARACLADITKGRVKRKKLPGGHSSLQRNNIITLSTTII